MTRRSTHSLVLALLALPACTQVLGLERAELDPDAGPGAGSSGSPALTKSSVPATGVACEESPGPACMDCLSSSCAGAEQRCLADPECRAELDDYAICLGRRCDSDQETCAFDIADRELRTCLSRCAADCVGTNLASPCELYCACMTDYCPGELDQLGDCMA